ncbi:MAG: ABC transporter permease [Deltaproteobacteria bacterium]|nr:ABC transporter permease [Deltaproteobacteria bacterium]
MMGSFVLKRLLHMVPLLLGITFLSFIIISLAPGDYLSTLKMNPQISEETINRLEQEFGLDKPVYIQYVKWLWQIVHLNFGDSIAYRVDVLSLIMSRAFNTIILSAASIIFAWSLAIPIGIAVAYWQNSFLDRFLSLIAFFGMAIPNFFLAFLLLYFALKTGWFPVGGSFSYDYDSLTLWGKFTDRLYHLILPVIVLGTSGMAGLMRLMRGNILEIKNSDYVRTARAKGLGEGVIIFKHVLRNALNPFITLAGYELGSLLGGAALVEAVLNLQGLGTMMLQAVMGQDIYLIMGSLLIGALLLIIGNLIADITLTLVDPRIKME